MTLCRLWVIRIGSVRGWVLPPTSLPRIDVAAVHFATVSGSYPDINLILYLYTLLTCRAKILRIWQLVT